MRVGLLVLAAIGVGAMAVYSLRSEHYNEVSAVASIKRQPAPLHQERIVLEASASDDPVRAFDSLQGEFVAQKYRYLLADSHLSSNAATTLQDLLVLREATDVPVDLDLIERKLRQLLHPSDFARYTQLADSDAEQQQLRDYVGGMKEVAPLSAEQERAILERKLRHKQSYDAALQRLELLREDLPLPEREQARVVAMRALDDYRREYLFDMRQLLNDEQYSALSSYETTEFANIRARLLSDF